jgi:transaldolase
MMKTLQRAGIDRVRDFVLEKAGSMAAAVRHGPDPFWKGLREAGTELWLDTGDMDAAGKLWTDEFSGLTTNNTLLNKEVQKGIYDQVIREAGELLKDLDTETRVVEVAFILNALHGLRLVKSFKARVSVELHTATAHDAETAAAYGRRFAAISSDSFIVKVPLTAAGLIATRTLRTEGIPVNFTLGFSARQNALAAAFAFPSYVNVFLGRLNAYVSDNALGDGLMVGEKATLASQREVRDISARTGRKTLQIAASIRDGTQVESLAGVDVMTIPVGAASDARARLTGKWESRVNRQYDVRLAPSTDEKKLRLSVLWDVTDQEKELGRSLNANPPHTADDLVARARRMGAADMFMQLTPDEAGQLAREGKIPKHGSWAKRIAEGETAVDTLLNLAGLASFTADQKALDDRVRGLVTR